LVRPSWKRSCTVWRDPSFCQAMPTDNSSASSNSGHLEHRLGDYTMLDAQDPRRRRTCAYGALLLAVGLCVLLLFAPQPAASLFAEEPVCDKESGERWCHAKSTCVRSTEVDMSSAAAFDAVCASALVGGDADEHGCRPSAGYRWCIMKKACVRPWEHGWRSESDFNAACKPLVIGGDTDEYGCIPSAGYRWCAKKAQCLRPWEHFSNPAGFEAECTEEIPQIPGADADAHGCRPSAGYQWCAKMSKCIRPWEEQLQSASDFEEACSE